MKNKLFNLVLCFLLILLCLFTGCSKSNNLKLIDLIKVDTSNHISIENVSLEITNDKGITKILDDKTLIKKFFSDIDNFEIGVAKSHSLPLLTPYYAIRVIGKKTDSNVKNSFVTFYTNEEYISLNADNSTYFKVNGNIDFDNYFNLAVSK